MLNFKFLKRISFFFVLAFALFSHNVSLAQERTGPRDSGMAILVESAEIKTGENGIEIEAVLFNPSPSIETPPATYLLILSNIDPLVKSKDLDYTPSSLIVSAQEGEDYFSLKPNERRTVKYFLPVSQYLPIANYSLNLRFMQRSGDIVGQHREILRSFGANNKKTSQVNYERGFLAFYQESCVILNAKGEKFEPNEGPVFDPSEQPRARCMVKNIGDEEIAVYPKIEWKEFFVFGRPSSGTRLEEKSSDSLVFKKGETKLVEVSLPAAQNPQVYQALLSFEDNNGNKRSFNMAFRWTIGGSSARVEKISLISPIKNIYEKGETISLSVDYFGSMDLYWRSSSDELAGLGGLRMLAIIKDKNGVICGQKELDLPDISDSGRMNQTIDVVLDKNCENSSYSVSVSSNNEKLAEETAEVPKTLESQSMKIYYYFGAIILFLILFMLIKRYRKTAGPMAMLFFAFIVFGMSFYSADASAIKTYTGISYGAGYYGGDSGENSAPMYSFYGIDDTNNVNKLIIKKVEVDLDTDLNGFYADIYYAAGFISCSNSTMHIRFKMYVEADGLEKTQVNFAPAGSMNYQSKQIRKYTSVIYAEDEDLFDIDPVSVSNFYDSDGIRRGNPYLIVEIVQSGKSTHANPYHRGDFSKPVSTVDFASRSDAFDASDMIRYKIPLNLPAPSVTLSASPTTVTYPTKDTTLTWNTADVSNCTASSPVFNDWTGTKSRGSGQTETIKNIWTGSKGLTADETHDFTLTCNRQIGGSTYEYKASTNVEVKAPPLKNLTINRTATGGPGSVKIEFSNDGLFGPPAYFVKENKDSAWIGKAASYFAGIAKASGRESLTFGHKLATTVSPPPCPLGGSSSSCSTSVPPIYVRLTAIPTDASSYSGGWDYCPAGGTVTTTTTAGDTCTFPMSSPTTVTAKFAAKTPDESLSVTCSASASSVVVGESVTFTATVNGGTPNYTYVWSGDVPSKTTTKSSLTDTNSQSYSSVGTKNAKIKVTDNSSPAQPAEATCSVDVTDSTILPPSGYNLTVIFGGTGTGSITKWIGNAGDSANDTKTWPSLSTSNEKNIVLQAISDTGSTFGGWNSTANMGNCTDNNGNSGTISTKDTTNDTCSFTLTGDKSLSVSFTKPSSSSASADPETVNLTLDITGSGTGKVKLYGWRATPLFIYDWNDYGETADNDFQDGETKGLGKDWWYKMVATPDSGSFFGGWSNCSSSDPKGVEPYSDGTCFVTMSGNKTAAVTFNSDGCVGVCGVDEVTASISARENPVLDGYTDIDWGSANASSCTQSDGGDDSVGWGNSDDTVSGSYDNKIAFTTSEGARTYTITCTNGSSSASASVDVEVGGVFGDGSVDIWADKSPIKNKGTTKIKWSSSNIISSECTLFSADSMNGYLGYFSSGNFGPGYYKQVIKNNLAGQITGNLTSDTAYKIRCMAKGPSYVTDQTTVIVNPPVSDFTFTNSTGAMTATIVEGLSANSSFITTELSGSAIGNVNLSANVPAILSGAKAKFSSDNGVTWNDTLSIDISAISQVKIKAIDIPGTTATGTYNVALTAKDVGVGGITKKLNVSLQVKKVSSEWQEF